MHLMCVTGTSVHAIIEVSKFKLVIEVAEALQQVLVEVCTRKLSRYVANNVTTIHHTDSVSVVTIAFLSHKNELVSQYRMPNAFIDVMSSNDTLQSTILFHLSYAIFSTGMRSSRWPRL